MHALKTFNTNLSLKDDALVIELVVSSNLVHMVIGALSVDLKVEYLLKKIEVEKTKDFMKKDYSGLYFQDKLYVHSSEVTDENLKKAYSQGFAMHSRATKMFQ